MLITKYLTSTTYSNYMSVLKTQQSGVHLAHTLSNKKYSFPFLQLKRTIGTQQKAPKYKLSCIYTTVCREMH